MDPSPSESPAKFGNLIGAIFSASPDAVVVVDASGIIVLSSPAVDRLFGYFPEELVGESIEVLIPADRRDRHVAHIQNFFAAPHARQMGVGLELAGQHRDGKSFAVDVSLTPVEVRGNHYVAAFVRDARERQRGIDRLRAVNEITQRLLSGSPVEEVLPFVAERARTLAGARASWVVTPTESGQLVIIAASGRGTESLIGIELSGQTSRSALVLVSGAVDILDDFSVAENVPEAVRSLGFGPGLYVPLISDGRPICTLVLAKAHDESQFDPLDIALAEVFASATAIAIELGESRHAVGRLQLVEEDERIARDLHDTVIQQLFAVGMSLEATRSTTTGALAHRIDSAVNDLDNVIREIRNTIFRLPGRSGEVRGLRVEMFQLVERSANELGFTPRLEFHGPLDFAVSDDVAAHLLQVLSEALSNVVRHAHAHSVDAVVESKDGWLSLSVGDDGVGISSAPLAGHGLRNMMARAESLGGNFEVVGRDPAGTIVHWRVPLNSK